MATKRVLPDKDFDRIIVRTHKLARNVTMRVKPDGLHVTVPPYSLSSKVLEVVEQYKQRLLEDWRKVSKKPIDLNFRIHTPCFRLWLEQGNFTCFSVRFTEDLLFHPGKTHYLLFIVHNMCFKSGKHQICFFINQCNW